MRLLFLTPDLSDYDSAFYQWDVFNKLKEEHELEPYGPGYENYDRRDDVQRIQKKVELEPDVICLGHGWLRDEPERPVRRNDNINLDSADVPTVLILNKEYRNFENKVQYAIDNEIDLIFTHHQKADKWTEEYDIPFVFWPFAVNSDRFRDYGEPKEFDLTFSGILRNPDPTIPQSDLRLAVQNHLFLTIGQVRLLRKPSYRGYNLFWRARAMSDLQHRVNEMLHREKRLPEDDYKKLLSRSKIGLNTLSPMDLVGTRYYETMASNTLAFCQASSIYEEHDLFVPGEHCVTFANDLSNFDEKLSYYLEADDKRRRIAKKGHEHVMANHTWEQRIADFTEAIQARF